METAGALHHTCSPAEPLHCQQPYQGDALVTSDEPALHTILNQTPLLKSEPDLGAVHPLGFEPLV
jgi:hypothetical protein